MWVVSYFRCRQNIIIRSTPWNQAYYHQKTEHDGKNQQLVPCFEGQIVADVHCLLISVAPMVFPQR